MAAAHIYLLVLGVADVKFERLKGDAPTWDVIKNVARMMVRQDGAWDTIHGYSSNDGPASGGAEYLVV